MDGWLLATIISGSVLGYLVFGYGLAWILYRMGQRLDQYDDMHFLVCTLGWPFLVLMTVVTVVVGAPVVLIVKSKYGQRSD